MATYRVILSIDIDARTEHEATLVAMDLACGDDRIVAYVTPTEAELLFETCEACGAEVDPDELRDVGGNLLCEDCTTECDACGSLGSTNNMYFLDCRELCEECYNDIFDAMDEDEERMDYEKG